jgi:alkylhydroperoxidase family enzyme
MPNYPVHTIASAPEKSKPALEQLQKAFGVLPNLPAVIANSPKLINSLVGLFGQVHSPGLSEAENQIVLLTDAVTNSSTYAVAFHTALALQQGISSEETTAIRERRLPKDKRFAALSKLAKTLIEKRGHLSEQELDFLDLASERRLLPVFRDPKAGGHILLVVIKVKVGSGRLRHVTTLRCGCQVPPGYLGAGGRVRQRVAHVITRDRVALAPEIGGDRGRLVLAPDAGQSHLWLSELVQRGMLCRIGDRGCAFSGFDRCEFIH